MIPFTKALEIALGGASPLPTERAPLHAALGRFLAEDLVADSDSPRFDNSSVDGYGVRAADVEGASKERPTRLKVLGVVAAGHPWAGDALPRAAALRIMTGAPVPPGVEAVVMLEDTAGEGPGLVLVTRGAATGENVRPRGGEFRAGARLLQRGTRVTPPVVALLAALGLRSVLVHALPRVHVLVTGSELADPGTLLAPGQIFDSNGPGLLAAASAMGISEVTLVRCEDDAGCIQAALDHALANADVVVTSGGASVGDYDFIPSAFEALGGQRRFWKVAMKPGKPNYFGSLERPGGGTTLFFGLPGNPVAALLSFEQFVRPVLLKLMGGADAAARTVTARLAAALEKPAGRLEWVRGRLRMQEGGLAVEPIATRESHMVSGLAQANALIAFPAEAEHLDAGTCVKVQLLDWMGS